MIKRICALCLTFMLLLQVIPAASAETDIDTSKKGSITVKVAYKGKALEGMKLSCVQVANLVPSGNSYYFTCSLDNTITFTADNIQNADNAKKMLELVKKSNVAVATKPVNKEGTIKFSYLGVGVYLIYQKEAYSIDNKDYVISPFLVTIPYDGKYDVDAKSKPSLDVVPKETTPPPPSTPNLPQTGLLQWPIPVMAAAGMVFFFLGWWLCFGRRKDPYEK